MRSISHLLICGIVSQLSTTPAMAQLASQVVAESDARGLAVAKDVVEIAFPPESRAKLFESVMNPLVAQMRAARMTTAGNQSDPGLDEITDRYIARALAEVREDLVVNAPGLFAAMARAYARNFSLSELVEIKAFVATPTGAKYIQRSSSVLSDPEVAACNTAYLQRLNQKVAAARQPLVDEIAAYLKKKRGK